MGRCDVCGNEYEKTLVITAAAMPAGQIDA
jgi:hypothetical protein